MKALFRSALLGLLLTTALIFGQTGQSCQNNVIGTPVIFWVNGTLFGCPSTSLGLSAPVWTPIVTANSSQFISVPLTLSQIQNLHSTPVQILGLTGTTGFGANTLIVMGSCTLNLLYGSAAYASGGVVTIGYGPTAAVASNATIAAATFTGLAANTAVLVGGALAATVTSSLINQPIFVGMATANFTGGTGGSGTLNCSYRVDTNIN